VYVVEASGIESRDWSRASTEATPVSTVTAVEAQMNLTIISVPYAGGRLEEGKGKGPSRHLAARPDGRLTELGHNVDLVTVHPRLEDAHDEPEAATRIAAVLGAAVSQAARSQRFPLVLAGNCNSCLGTLAGPQLERGDAGPGEGIVWFDTHGDLNTPESSPGGFFDGMGLCSFRRRASCYPTPGGAGGADRGAGDR
jgi:arginase